ncbi:putative neutral amino acid permease protein [Rosellinia necatrix]|uniref:Putative neutral amino acid permease protein n=1 Tax=Rosellinia necatrix TaxID=77044 RepID=A0A1S7UI51_ROSNE|nr:putative neutral amino acid permease protein [Rosellinia necatrix]
METPITPVSAVAAPFAGTPRGSNDEITEIWKEVEDRILQMVGGNRAKIKQDLSIEQVLQCLDDAQAEDKRAAEKHGTLKKVFNHTLDCIAIIGGLVADSASCVFQPASTCYNALTFVIQAWRGYEGMFESLGGLLEQCGEFLDRLTYYTASRMDATMTKVACRHLHLFVEICDRILKLNRTRSKIKAFTKQLFLGDDGVQDLLGRMNNLVNQEHRLASAQTFKFSNEAAENSRDNLVLTKRTDTKLDILMKDKKLKDHSEETKKWKDALRDALDFDRSELDNGEPIERWREGLRKYRADVIDGTGDWINKHHSFMSWIKGDSSPVLGIEGGDATGKTRLATNIIMSLRRLNAFETSSSRSAVAYYFLETGSKAAVEKNNVGESMSKSLLWQLANADRPFLKSAANICEKSKPFKNHQEMWIKLLLENDDRINSDSVFFIVIDGVGDGIVALAPLFKKLSTEPKRQRTRVLFTGKPNVFDKLDIVDGVDFNKIVLKHSNEEDIKLYIRTRLDGMEILKDRDRPNISEMRDKIFNTLTTKTSDYSTLSSVLDNIAQSGGDIGEIDDCLNMAGQTTYNQLIKEIEQLNKIRSSKEIDEINEIILWINWSQEPHTPSRMEAALTLRTGSASSQQKSLLSLQSKIATKYSLFAVVGGVVGYKLPEGFDGIPRKNQEKSVDGSAIIRTEEIHPAEIEMLKHYLSNVCPRNVYDKFEFDDFFDRKLVRKGTYICQDPDNAHITLAIRCLTCLVEQRTDTAEKMHYYAHEQLYRHLELTDLSLADRDLKAEAGEKLAKLFTTDYGIESLLYPDPIGDTKRHLGSQLDIPFNWDNWLFMDEGAILLSVWFKDSAVLEKIKESEFVKDYNAIDAKRHDLMFALGLKQAAMRLFREESPKRQLLNAFSFLQSFFERDAYKAQEQDLGKFFHSLYNPTVEKVILVEEWSKRKLGIEKDSLWEAQVANLLFYLSEEGTITKDHAESRAREALKLDPENWRASHTLAKVIESRDEAVAILSSVIEKRVLDTEWRDKKANKDILAEMLIGLGDIYWKYEDKAALATETYLKSLDESCSLFSNYMDILENLTDQKEFDSAITFVEKLLNDTTGDTLNTLKNVAMQSSHDAQDVIGLVARAAHATNRWGSLDKCYKEAVIAPLDIFTYTYRLQYGHHIAKAKGREEEACAVLEAIHRDGSKVDDEELRLFAIRTLPATVVPIYTQLTFADGAKTEAAEAIHNKVDGLYREFKAVEQTNIDSTLALAHYYFLYSDDLRAKELVRSIVIQALELLSDDDIENDQTSFWELSRVFCTLKDKANTLASWHLNAKAAKAGMKANEEKRRASEEEAKKKLEEKQEGSVQDTELQEKQEDPAQDTDAAPRQEETVPESLGSLVPSEPSGAISYCDGDCGHMWSYPTGLWTCISDTGAVQFDEKCYRKLVEGTLEVPVCSRDHYFYYIDMKDDVEEGSVRVGDRVVTVQEWKSEVRAKYVDFDVV